MNRMHYFGAIWLVLLLSCSHTPASDNGKSTPIVIQDSTYKTLEELSPKQIGDWEEFHQNFILGAFKEMLQVRGLKQDCMICGDIFCEVRFEVDEDGKASMGEIMRVEIDCPGVKDLDEDALRGDMIRYILNEPWPDSLREGRFELRIGNVTRC